MCNVVFVNHAYPQGRQSGLKSVGAQRGGNFGVFLPRNGENYRVAVFTYHK